AVVDSGQPRNCPRADARGFWDSRCLLMNVVIPNRTNIDFWIEHPRAQREAFLVLTGGSDLLRKGARGTAHEQCYERDGRAANHLYSLPQHCPAPLESQPDRRILVPIAASQWGFLAWKR